MDGDFLWRLFTDSSKKFETLFLRHPPFYVDISTHGSLAYTAKTTEPHKNGFILLNLKRQISLTLSLVLERLELSKMQP